MKTEISAVLVAAGASTRMGFDKLSVDLGGETVLHRSIRAFAQCPQVDEIVLVAGKNRAFVEAQAADCKKPVQIGGGRDDRHRTALRSQPPRQRIGPAQMAGGCPRCGPALCQCGGH